MASFYPISKISLGQQECWIASAGAGMVFANCVIVHLPWDEMFYF